MTSYRYEYCLTGGRLVRVPTLVFRLIPRRVRFNKCRMVKA